MASFTESTEPHCGAAALAAWPLLRSIVQGTRVVVVGDAAVSAVVRAAGAAAIDARRADGDGSRSVEDARGDPVILAVDAARSAGDIADVVSRIRALATRKNQRVVVAAGDATLRDRLVSCLEGSDFEVLLQEGGARHEGGVARHEGTVARHEGTVARHEGTVALLEALCDEPDPIFADVETLEFDGIAVAQTPRGADGLGGVVWPNAIALARWLSPKIDARCSIFELGAGTGILGLALAQHAGRTTLSDEFVGLLAWNCRHAPNVDVRRVRSPRGSRTSRVAAAAATWIFRGDESPATRDADV